jgi:hypothetical protein
MKTTHRKRSHERVVKTSISLPPKLFEFSAQRVREEGHASLSGFLQSLLRQRAERNQFKTVATP